MALQQTEIELCEVLHGELQELTHNEQAVFHYCFSAFTQDISPILELNRSIQIVQGYKSLKQRQQLAA